jgi:hypothetical protein
MLSAALTWGYTTNHFSTVLKRLLRVEGTLPARKTLTDNLSVSID